MSIRNYIAPLEAGRQHFMTVYDKTVDMLKSLKDEDLLKVQAYISRCITDGSVNDEIFSPLSEDEIYDLLASSRTLSDSGAVIEAGSVSAELRRKYGI